MEKKYIFILIISAVLLSSIITYLSSDIYNYYFVKNIVPELNKDSKLNIYIKQEVIDKLNYDYAYNYNEFLYCLIGKRDKNNVYIESLFKPKIYNSTRYSAETAFCFDVKNSLGSVHSHPEENINSCYPSPQDIYVWGELTNPEPVVNGVICGYNKIMLFEMPSVDTTLTLKRLKLNPSLY